MALTEKRKRFWRDLLEKEEKRYEKVQRAIEKKDKKKLDRYIDCFLGRISKSKCEEWL